MTKVVAGSNRISKHDAPTGKIRIKRPDTKQKKQVSRKNSAFTHYTLASVKILNLALFNPHSKLFWKTPNFSKTYDDSLM
jgi:hypothetical protein